MTVPPAGIDPVTWEAACEAMRRRTHELRDIEYDEMLSAALEVLGGGMAVWTEWGVRYEKGVSEHTSEERARVFAEAHGRPLMSRLRGVGPWSPVDEGTGP